MTNIVLPQQLVSDLFKEIQSQATPLIWSQGVTLTRGKNEFVFSKQSADECVIKIRLAGQAINPKVSLWPQEQDWDCDCGEDENPCVHVCASVILLKRGEIKTSSDESSKDSSYELSYIFLDSPEGLKLERWITHPTLKDKFPLTGNLLNYKSGVQTGRLKSPDILASKNDFAIDQALKNYLGKGLERSRLEILFQTFESDQKIFLESDPIQISSSRLLAQYECFDEADGFRLKRVENSLIIKKFRHGVALCKEIAGVPALRLMNSTQLSPEDQKLVEGEGTFWPSSQEKILFGELIPRLQKKIAIEIKSLKRPQTLDIPPHIELKLESEMIESGERVLSVLANIVYGDPPLMQLNYSTLELNPVQGNRSPKIAMVVQRQKEIERQLMQKLSRELNLQPNRRIQLRAQEAIDFVKLCRNWKVEGDGEKYFSPDTTHLEVKLTVHDKAPSQYQFNVQFVSSEGQIENIDFNKIYEAWQEGRNSFPLINGQWAQIPKDWFKRYGKRVQEFLTSLNATKEITAQNTPELSKICKDLGVAIPPSLQKLTDLLEDFKQIPESQLPSDLKAELRPYQKKGVSWLCFLRDAGLGALLADDMGLGKTLQTLCAIKGRTLIVAPTSVLFNWAQEIPKFRPSLKVSTYYGSKRELNTLADVTLTSYGLLRLDQSQLSKEHWNTIVLDEAQIIKNPESQVTRASHSLKGDFRVTLSGTPIENKLDDLWSQFEFINPKLLGTHESFKDKYARPISQGDSEAAKRLRMLIKPFFLRRLKRDVAPELPPRTETVLYCELSSIERELYETLLASTRKEVLSTLESGGSVIKALELILRLRQACCHPGLVPGLMKGITPSNELYLSSKIDLLVNTLQESLEEGHKSLIFSQWTSFLDKIGDELKKKNINFSRIDGSTTHRQTIVNEFQGNSGPPIMLISLKAGGVGLNLTAADHVFICDPWWNPTVEDQAADRAHRIGQQNPVMIHRLVAKDSIEERILELQESKRDLAKAVLEDGHASLNLTRDDLLNLLK